MIGGTLLRIGMLERGARLPRIDTILKLAGGLEIHPGELLEGVTWHPGPHRPGRFQIDGQITCE
jgi:hypothetical protein